VIAAGFDSGSPAYKPSEPSRRSGQKEPTSGTGTAGADGTGVPPSQQARKVLFDDVDVPDFLKNGS
jgi:cell division protein FtsZ